jgi:hypothetical protein
VKREGRGSLSVGDMLEDVEASGGGDEGVRYVEDQLPFDRIE